MQINETILKVIPEINPLINHPYLPPTTPANSNTAYSLFQGRTSTKGSACETDFIFCYHCETPEIVLKSLGDNA
jgi:hypothetical protein